MNRHLKFNSLEDALAELKNLERGPVETTGLWSFFQILTHCAEALEFCVSRYPQEAPWLIRATVGRLAFKGLLKQGYFPPGTPHYHSRISHEREEGDEKAAMARLKKAIAAFQAYTGPMARHPFYGKIGREDFERLQLLHLAHHLGFAQIKT